jgi:putative membrane protein
MHDISEEYLYSVHMFQHMVLAYFVPPLVLLAIPEWLFRAVLTGSDRAFAAGADIKEMSDKSSFKKVFF